MKKIQLLLLLLMPVMAMAQKLSKADIKNFKAVALYPDNPLDRKPVIKKWNQPVYYKIYGSEDQNFDETVERTTNSTFEQLGVLTGLQIRKAEGNDPVNFTIIIGKPEKAGANITPDAMAYVKGKKGSQTYYTTIDQNIASMLVIIDPNEYTERGQIRTVTKVLIVYGMGFFGKLNITDNSVFSARPNMLTQNFKTEDNERIKLMYNPAIKSGMTENELDEVLKTIE